MRTEMGPAGPTVRAQPDRGEGSPLMGTAPEQDAAIANGQMTVWEHLAELRTRLIKAALAVAVGAVIAWTIYPWVIKFLLHPYSLITDDPKLYATDPLEPFAIRIKVSGYLGIVLALPVILWQIWRFIAPGLYAREKKYALPFILSSIILFLFGASIAYLTLNPALEFLIGIGGTDIEQIYSPESYIMLIVWMMLAFGAGFIIPVILVALELMGVIHPRQLLSWWRTAIVLIAVVAAVITPSGDPISMFALAAPMTILYFGAVGIGALVLRRRSNASTTSAGNHS